MLIWAFPIPVYCVIVISPWWRPEHDGRNVGLTIVFKAGIKIAYSCTLEGEWKGRHEHGREKTNDEEDQLHSKIIWMREMIKMHNPEFDHTHKLPISNTIKFQISCDELRGVHSSVLRLPLDSALSCSLNPAHPGGGVWSCSQIWRVIDHVNSLCPGTVMRYLRTLVLLCKQDMFRC